MPTVPRPALAGAEEAEIAVVGAGIAGLSLAAQLAGEGRDVAVLEAQEAGAGALGASAGIVAPQLVRTTPNRVLARLGPGLGDYWLRLVGESGGHLFGLIGTLGIACDARPQGFISPSRADEAAPRLARIVEEWLPFRRDLDVLDGDALAALSGCRGYVAGILDQSGGGVDPRRLAQGLATAAVEAGARLFHHSEVIAIEPAGGRWRLRTPAGALVAGTVVLCANGGNRRLHPALADTILPMRVPEMVTAPLPPAMRAAVLPQGHSLTDLERDIFSIRMIEGGRLLTFHPLGRRATAATAERAVNRRLREMLRVWEPIGIEHLWDGVAWMNSSLLPRVALLGPGLLAVQACNGRGIATNAIVGREIARLLLSKGRYSLPLVSGPPHPVRGFTLVRHLPEMLLWSARAASRVGSAFLPGKR